MIIFKINKIIMKMKKKWKSYKLLTNIQIINKIKNKIKIY